MSLSDAAALMKGALKRKSSFRERGAKVRVLSVDDDPVNQLVIQNLLAPVGYEILQVSGSCGPGGGWGLAGLKEGVGVQVKAGWPAGVAEVWWRCL